MKERPILFSGSMVRALLAGTKTQTRRVVKPQPNFKSPVRAYHRPDGQYKWVLQSGMGDGAVSGGFSCPYGQPGDRLYVKETHEYNDIGSGMCEVLYMADGVRIWKELSADDDAKIKRMGKARPSIHMPHWASRITLEVTGIRVERLQDISHDDACAEGIENTRGGVEACVGRYRDLWESINGPGSWDANPWVWVVEFKRVG